MVDNIQVPPDITELLKVEWNDEALREFIINVTSKLQELETRVEELEKKNA